MEMTTHLSCLLFLLLLWGSCEFLTAKEFDKGPDDDLRSRLEKIEATLETVLAKNEQLEKRISVLEEENQVLREQFTEKFKPETADSGKPGRLAPAQKPRTHKHGRIDLYRGKPTLETARKPKRQLNAATVAFTAVINPPSINVGPGQTVVYDGVITNVGGAYDSTTGIFTAPVSGVYAFNFAEMIDAGKNEYLEIVKDGAHVIWNYGHAYGANHLVSSSRTVTVEVSKGSQVWVQTQNSGAHGTGIIHGNSFTTFSGWLLAVNE